MPKTRAQHINDFRHNVWELERIRAQNTLRPSEDLQLRAEATSEIAHALAIRAMRRSSGSVRSQLAAMTMQVIINADLPNTELILQE